MDKTFELLTALADGCPHSGGALADRFGVSRAAIWERVQRLREMGADIYAVSGKGYQLARAFEFLSASAIEAELSGSARAVLQPITVAASVDSTNQRLLDASALRNVHGEAWLAEFQTAGRGRRGRVACAGYGYCKVLCSPFAGVAEDADVGGDAAVWLPEAGGANDRRAVGGIAGAAREWGAAAAAACRRAKGRKGNVGDERTASGAADRYVVVGGGGRLAVLAAGGRSWRPRRRHGRPRNAHLAARRRHAARGEGQQRLRAVEQAEAERPHERAVGEAKAERLDTDVET